MRASSKTTDRDLGEKELLKILGQMKTTFVEVGLFEGEEHPESKELSIAQIGTVHEFGSSDGRVPARPWLSTTHDKHEARYRGLLDRAYSQILAGKVKVGMALQAFGEKAASDARRMITDIKDPPKADATLARQGERFNNPLIWLGYMRAAVRSRITVGATKALTTKGSR